MGTLEVIDNLPVTRARRFDVRVLAAFFAIYFLWGATFLAIRVAALEIPPFFTAGLRFFWRMLAAVALGLGGIALLLLKNGGQSFGVFPCLVILAGSVAWTLGAV